MFQYSPTNGIHRDHSNAGVHSAPTPSSISMRQNRKVAEVMPLSTPISHSASDNRSPEPHLLQRQARQSPLLHRCNCVRLKPHERRGSEPAMRLWQSARPSVACHARCARRTSRRPCAMPATLSWRAIVAPLQSYSSAVEPLDASVWLWCGTTGPPTSIRKGGVKEALRLTPRERDPLTLSPRSCCCG